MARLLRWGGYLAITLLFLAATVVAVGRYVLTYIHTWTPEIEASASQWLGGEVLIGELQGQWQGADPGLLLQNVRWQHPLGQIQISHAQIELNLWASLLRREWVFRTLDIRGVSVSTDQTLESWLARLPDAQDTTASAGLPGIHSLTLQNVQLSLPVGQRTQTWTLAWLTLGESTSGRPWLDAQLKGPTGQASGTLRMAVADTGELKAVVQVPDLMPWWPAMNDFWPETFYRLEGAGRLWVSFKEGAWQEVTLQVEDVQAGLMLNNQCLAPLSLPAYTLSARRDGRAWQIRGSESVLQWSDQRLTLAPFTLKSGDRGYDLQIAHVALAPSARLVSALGLSASLSGYLADYSPEGSLTDVHVYPDNQGRYTLDAQLKNVAAHAYDGSPAGRHINGFLRANAMGGWVQFSTDNLTLAFPELYTRGWRFRHGSGRVQWRTASGQMDLWGEDIRLEPVNGGTITGRFHMRSPDEGADRFMLDLRIAQMPVNQAADFVPDRAVSEALMAWLHSALQAGMIQSAHYRYDGYLGGDSQPADRVSLLHLQAQDVALEFAQSWPALQIPEATLALRDGELDIGFERAHLPAGALRKVRARLWQPDGEHSELVLKGDVYLPQEGLRWWLSASPVASELPESVRALSYDRPLNGHLEMTLPITVGDPQIRLSLNFDGGRLDGLPRPVKAVAQLTGTLEYHSQTGLQASSLKGEVLGAPLTARISTNDQRQVSLEGLLDAGTSFWNAALGASIARRLTGQSRLRVALAMAGGSGWHFKADSELKGLAIDLPEPLKKPAEQSRPFSVELFSAARGALDVTGRLAGDRDLFWRARYESGRWQSTLTEDSRETVALPEAGIFRIRLDQLDMAAWAEVLKALGARVDSVPQAFKAYQLQVGQVEYGGRRLNHLDVSWTPGENSWRLAGQADGIAGELEVPRSGEWNMQLTSLDLDQILASVKVPDDETPILPQSLPAVRLSIDSLRAGDRQMGQWQGRIEPVDDGILFRDVSIRIGDSLTTGSMHWVYTPTNGQHNTVVSFESKGKDFRVISDAFDLKSPLSSSSFSLIGGLVWMDRPDRFDWSQLFGRFDVEMKSGVIREVAASTNIFRLLGVLNTETLTRRLKLDFSDLYKSGMSYDVLSAKTRIQAGVMRFTQPLVIQTPSSAYNLSGEVDLNRDTLNMQMIVALPVSKNLPLAALLLGAPQVGGALFLLDKLLGDPLSNLTTATFDVKGTLSDPKVTLKNVMNPPKNRDDQ